LRVATAASVPRTQGPVPPAERIVALDVFRGFAMFGVLVAYCVWSLGTLPSELFTPLDRALEPLVGFAVDGKFYTILAFLFGLGFQLQLGRAANDPRSVRLYGRRLLVLAGLGLLHALLLRNGDILLPYAATGFLLILLRRESDRALVAIALLFLLLPFAAQALWQASGLPLPARPAGAGGGYWVENFAWVRYWYATAILNWPPNLTLFLFGLLAGRHAVVARLAAHPQAAAAILAAGLVAGAGCYVVTNWLRAGREFGAAQRIAASLLFDLHAWSLAAAYMAALLLALRSEAGSRLLLPLAAVGRMALTNYLMQAALLVPLCLAFGWFDRFTPSRGVLLALAVFLLIQIPFSLLWLRRHAFGPAEWLWRLLTYGALPGPGAARAAVVAGARPPAASSPNRET
jgi:uncharacterized protein